MPDHVHLLIRKHRDDAETMIENLQKLTRVEFLAGDNAINREHPLWTAGGWKRFLGSPNAVRTVIRYIEGNPAKSKLPPQRWPFVRPTTIGHFTRAGPNSVAASLTLAD